MNRVVITYSFLEASSFAKEMAQGIASHWAVPVHRVHVRRFLDGEFDLSLDLPFALGGKHVVLVHEFYPWINDGVMLLLFMADAIKQRGVARLSVVIPYWPYSRQDQLQQGVNPSHGMKHFMKAVGVDQVITLDLHRPSFDPWLISLDPWEIFVPLVIPYSPVVVVTPDSGGLRRAQTFAKKIQSPWALIPKKRNSLGSCVRTEVIGEVQGRHCILVDDIVDTGTTLATAAQLLAEKGALSILACVTHGVCSRALPPSPIQKIYITNSIFHEQFPPLVHVISVKALLGQAILALSPLNTRDSLARQRLS